MTAALLGHAVALSEDIDARGGAVGRCLHGPCPWRFEGTEAQVVTAALDHHEETLRAR